MGTNRVALVVDSAASLPAGLKAEPGLQVVPMRLSFGGSTYTDGVDLTPTAFYQILRGLKETPVTSAPSPASYLAAFRAAARNAGSVLCLTVSPRFSSSYDSARTAVLEAKEQLPHTQIELLDTESAAGGEGLVVTEALRAAMLGAGLDEVVASARAVVPMVTLLAFLDTLYFVWKGGRVPMIAHAGASLLRIKPLLEMSRGEVRNVARARTAPRARERLLELMRDRATSRSVHAAIMHADAADTAGRLKDAVELEFDCEELYVSEFSPVMGSHTGPGLVGVAFWCE